MEPENLQNPQPEQPKRQDNTVYVARPLEPARVHVSEEVAKRHQESKAKYPFLNLSEGEYVISAVSRHWIGLFQIWFFGGLVGAVILAGVLYLSRSQALGDLSSVFAVILLPVLILVLAGVFIGSYVYNANHFYLTNESVIQEIQSSLFSKQMQTVSLENIEDASYKKQGIPAYIFNYGNIRLSTQGDETTYRFAYASEPDKQIALLNNAVEAFKNGRPVEG